MKYLVGTVFALFFIVRAISILARSRVDASSPRGIARALTGPSHRHVVRIQANRFVWNPSAPLGEKNRVYGPGTATYSYDGAVVTLDFAPSSGEARRYTGPLPEGLTAPDQTPALWAVIAPPALAIAIFALSLWAIGNSFVTAALLGMAAWVLTVLITMVTNQTIRTQAFAAGRAG
ncbi:MAG: hypothetical protein JO246_06365 [Frankiaceae bacterium]|nr:hypothetical protein [Frankiaceae bacterium]MBV9870551.1 hypothetical protein [Frankiaceae bacterium]